LEANSSIFCEPRKKEHGRARNDDVSSKWPSKKRGRQKKTGLGGKTPTRSGDAIRLGYPFKMERPWEESINNNGGRKEVGKKKGAIETETTTRQSPSRSGHLKSVHVALGAIGQENVRGMENAPIRVKMAW